MLKPRIGPLVGLSLFIGASSASANTYQLDLPALQGTFSYGFSDSYSIGDSAYGGPLIVPFDFGTRFDSITSVTVTMNDSVIVLWSPGPMEADQSRTPYGQIVFAVGFYPPPSTATSPPTVIDLGEVDLADAFKAGRGNLQFSLYWVPTLPIDFQNFTPPPPLVVDRAHITFVGQAAAVPEPSTLLSGSCLLVTLLLRRRRFAAQAT